MAKRQTKMSKEIMEEIESNEVQMHSKVYFQVLQVALIGVAGLFIVVSALTMIVVFRDVKYGEELGLRGYGQQGYTDYVQALPWLAIVLGLLGFLIAYTLVKRFDFSYKHRYYTIVGALIFAVAGLGVVFAVTGTDKPFIETGPLRGLHTLSDEYAKRNVVAGEVVYIETSYVTILSVEQKKVEVYYSEDFRGNKEALEVGDNVYAFGEQKDGKFEAYVIRKGRKPRPPHIKGAFYIILK